MRPASDEPTWEVPAKFGYAEAVQSAGTIVAPLLAGFTIALIGLVVDTSNNGIRHRDLALLVLMAAATALLVSIQCAYSARQYLATPEQIEAWYPELANDDAGAPGTERSRPTQTWWAARAEQASHAALHTRWARRFRFAYHTGIVLVLCGLAVTLIPPGHVSPTRYAAVGLATFAALAEAAWVTATTLSPLTAPCENELASLPQTKRPRAHRAMWRVAHIPGVTTVVTWAVPLYRPGLHSVSDPRKAHSPASGEVHEEGEKAARLADAETGGQTHGQAASLADDSTPGMRQREDGAPASDVQRQVTQSGRGRGSVDDES